MSSETSSVIKSAAVIGLGSVGSSWAALMLAQGIEVRGFDPGDGADALSKDLIAKAWPSLVQLGLTVDPDPPFQRLTIVAAIEAAVDGAEVVFENVPERLTLKREVLAKVDVAAPSDALILSSAGGIAPSELQVSCERPDRLAVMHPFNPAHLIPLVEIVPGKETSTDTIERAKAFAASIGKHPIVVAEGKPGHMVNRFQFALVREAFRCLADGVASAEDIDAAVRYGLAPRWLLMGSLHTVSLAGGPDGMRGALDRFGRAMEQWWATDGSYELTEDMESQIAAAAGRLNGEAGFADWVGWRDEQLVSLLDLQAHADAARPGHRKGN
ncbi:MAG: 3-hydroxyacyl-CoA dehydrogenase NAD-binding domain-containing protein [Pseudomonadota bacterium]